MNLTELQSKTIDFLRFPLTILVVFIHIEPEIDMQTINYSALSGNDIYYLLRVIFSNVIPHIAVPLFFLISGFLFFLNIDKWTKDVYINKMGNRFKTLFIPYIFWNVVAILATLFFQLIPFLHKGKEMIILTELKGNGILKIFWNWNCSGGPYDLPLWFLRDLIIVTILTPIVYYFIRYTKFYGIILLAVLYFLYSNTSTFPIGLSITALFFFSFGAYCGINKKNLIEVARRIKLNCFILCFISLILDIYTYHTFFNHYIHPIYIISGVFVIVNLASSWIERNTIKPNVFLSKVSFFVFAIHTILILSWTEKMYFYIFRPISAISLIIKYFVVPFVAIFICLSIYYLLKKLFPRILILATGNR